jgi:hypothetical protein
MIMKNTNISMGSSIIDFYMDGFDEGKNDDIEVVKSVPQAKKRRSDKERASARRKKSYFKSKGRMAQLDHVDHYSPAAKDEAVVMGMLRSHQLPISDSALTCGCSIGNKRRRDAAEQKIFEHAAQGAENAPV